VCEKEEEKEEEVVMVVGERTVVTGPEWRAKKASCALLQSLGPP
jgi:hypothetical protein